MIKFGQQYRQALEHEKPGTPVGKHVNPAFGEWLHGLPHNWTAGDKVVGPQHADATPALTGISMRAAQLAFVAPVTAC